jgi:hypothetical protein
MFENAKPGEVVATYNRTGLHGAEKILKLTLTQVITTHGNKYNRKTGRSIPWDSFHCCEIAPMTDAVKNQLTQRSLARKLKEFNWSNVGLITEQEIIGTLRRGGHDI